MLLEMFAYFHFDKTHFETLDSNSCWETLFKANNSTYIAKVNFLTRLKYM